MYSLLFFMPILAAVYLSFENVNSRLWQALLILPLVALIFVGIHLAGILGAIITIALIIKQQLPERRDI